MGVAGIGCHYFTPDCGEAAAAIKRLAGCVPAEETVLLSIYEAVGD